MNVTDGNGTVNSTYRYEADTGSINISRDSGWTNVTLSDPDHSSLAVQWALDNSTASNHTVRVGPGTYNGTISLTADDRTVEAPSGSGTTTLTERSGQNTVGIRVNATNVTIADLSVENFSSDGIRVNNSATNVSIADSEILSNDDNGIEFATPTSSNNDHVVVNTTISGNLQQAIYVAQTSDVTLRNNTITNASAVGIELYSSHDSVIENNTFRANFGGSFTAIDLTGAAQNNYVANNTIRDGDGDGILVGGDNDDATSNTLLGNSIRNVTGTGVIVENNDTVIRGHTINDTGGRGLFVDGGNHLLVENLAVSNASSYGIRINQSVNVSIVGATVEDNGDDGINVSGYSSNVTIQDSAIRDNEGYGLILDSPAGAHYDEVLNNTFSGNIGTAILADRAHDNEFRNNTITESAGTGIELFSSFDNVVADNVIHNNSGLAFTGIDLNGNAERNRLVNNTIRDNVGTGIMIGGKSDSANSTVVVDTTVVNSTGTGIFVYANDTTIRNTSSNQHGNRGIYVDGGNDLVIENVTASNASSYGIVINQSVNVSIDASTVADNGNAGITLNGSSSNVSITDTSSANNTASELRIGPIGSGIDATNFSAGTVTYGIHAASNVTLSQLAGNPPGAPSGVEAVGPAGNVSSLGRGYVNVSRNYTDAQADGIDETTIELYRYNDSAGSWSSVASSGVDAGTNTVSANLTNFSTFRMFGEASSGGGGGGGSFLPPDDDGGPSFSIASVDLSTTEVGVGETVTVEVRVDNDGDADGEYTANLTADGQQVDSATGSINANWHRTFTLSTSFSQPGTYQLAVNGESAGTVQVTGSASLSVGDVSFSSTNVTAGDSVTITVPVTNDGDAEGTVDVPLVVDGEQVDSRTVTLGPGESTTVTFEHTFEASGSQSVSVAGQSAGAVEVTESATQSDETSNDGSGSGGTSPILLVGIVIGLGIAGIGAAYWYAPEAFEDLIQR